ncbi:MAG: hypothetical protein A3H97_01760 [Acidobacteria bacterium RIFCSPLOWO2_02_FULL_65_29]|nr:MAG: hypothetical protein A3H97_01760 [Acidobacteria bacterium RIFCSPLOWO2_02_FULL_65_29]
MVELDHGLAEDLQHGGPTVREAIVPPAPFPLADSGFGPQPPVAFQTLQERIERARADVVAMASQLAEDPLADDWMLGRVMKNVDFPEAQQDLSREQL